MTRARDGFQIEVYGRTFSMWYDRADRVWVIAQIDGAGNQIGEADYAASRDLALIYIGITGNDLAGRAGDLRKD
jgi:hypothetical protein